MLLRDTIDEQIKIYCLFDSDYHTKKQIKEREQDAEKLGVEIHIWKRKEIENYLVVPAAILRILKAEAKTEVDVEENDIKVVIDEIVERYEEKIIHSIATEIQCENRKLSIPTAIDEARKNIEALFTRISGKELISQLSAWSHQKFHVTLNPIKLAQYLEKRDIDKEVVQVLETIENSKEFPE